MTRGSIPVGIGNLRQIRAFIGRLGWVSHSKTLVHFCPDALYLGGLVFRDEK